MDSKPIDIRKYHRGYVHTLSEEAQQTMRQEHLNRMQQGRAVWNAWAKQVLEAIEQAYPQNATEAEKLAIHNQYKIDFSGVEFDEEADFSVFIFPIAADFAKATFSGRANFWEATFSGKAYFRQATFSGEAYFREATFSGEAYFGKATFSGKVDFWKATFSSEAYFSRATFSGEAYFNRATFSGVAIFGQATFSGVAVFLYATFSGGAIFSWATFSGVTVFLGAQFQQQSLFINMKLLDVAKEIPCDFRQTYFHLPPLVDDFPSDVAQFIKANKSIERDKEFYKDCEAKFRALKQLAERNNHHQKTLEFYGCELYCQRQACGGWHKPKNWVSYFYGLLSGYGLSLWRPTLLWLTVMFSSIYIQAHYDDRISCCPETIHISWERLGFYVAPSMPPFVGKPLYQKEVRHRLYKNKVDKDLNGQLPTFNRVVRFFQSLITFITLFLFGLALRNRFKIG